MGPDCPADDILDETNPLCVDVCVLAADEDAFDEDMESIIAAANALFPPETAAWIINGEIGTNPAPPPGFLEVPTKNGNPPFRWNTLGVGQIVKIPGGQVNDWGWFQVPANFIHKDTGELLMTSEDYIAANTSDDSPHPDGPETPPQDDLDKVLDVLPLGNQELIQLVDRTCVAIVHNGDISINWDQRDGSGPKLPNANLQGDRRGRVTLKFLGVEVPGSLNESQSSTSLYDLWVEVLPDMDFGTPTAFPVHTEPDSIQITRAKQTGNTVNVRATSSVPCPADGFMTASIDGADAGANPPDNDPLDNPFVLEFPMSCAGGGSYAAVIPRDGTDLRGRRLVVQTAFGGAYGNVTIQ